MKPFTDKFDQFWAVNRRLMEVNNVPSGRSGTPSDSGSSNTSTVEESTTNFKTFKHIPIRIYASDQLLSLKLIKPTKTCDNGSERWTTLEDLIGEYFPNGNHPTKILTQGIEPDLDTPLQWMAEHLSYPDNFLHIVTLE